MPKLYIDDFVGISNKLETLPMAFAIRKEHGHEIILDWPELDAFSVAETRREKIRVAARLGAIRVRTCDDRLFRRLKGKKIILRSLDGPAFQLDSIYMDVAAKIRLNLEPALAIREEFARFDGRPVVGIHVRRGDYLDDGDDRYDIRELEWPSVPLWWYEQAMAAIVRRQKDAIFFLSATGDPDSYRALWKNFDLFSLDIPNPYGYKGGGHESRVHPVVDLFALACCPVILATPLSGYSHWASNVLGDPSSCLVPIPGMTRADPAMGLLRLYGMRLPVWRAFARQSRNTQRVSEALEGVDLSLSGNTNWLG
ncbi:hypothetical protein EP232_03840 [bacterium]|nr:MAG: hypothetical protein EP232_03840 [bacterium]